MRRLPRRKTEPVGCSASVRDGAGHHAHTERDGESASGLHPGGAARVRHGAPVGGSGVGADRAARREGVHTEPRIAAVARYTFHTRWPWLRRALDPIIQRVFLRDIRGRLAGLKRGAEQDGLLRHLTA